MPTVTALTSGNATVDSSTITTAAVTPAANSLVLIGIHNIATTAPCDRVSSVVGNGITYFPVADLTTNYTTYTGRLSLWAGMAAAPTNTTIVAQTAASSASAWAVLQCTNVDTTSMFGVLGVAAIRQIGLITATTGGGINGATIYMSEGRSNGNATVGFFSHPANEGSTPGTGLTELADQFNVDLGNIEAAWSATYLRRVGVTWGTPTTPYAGIAVEVAEPNNVTFVPQPIDTLYG